MLLEEILLHLLNGTGYRTVDTVGTDRTLRRGHSGLEVRGRGGKHQIDAIADFQVPHPFSHRQRLLVEAKCFSPGYQVGIEIVRNAIGVLKDVSEYWVTRGRSSIPKTRYHYQYALFSATTYSSDAQRYAFAHDIYLIPVGKSNYLISTIDAIRALTRNDFGHLRRDDISIDLKTMRRVVRRALRSERIPELLDYQEPVRNKLIKVLENALRIHYALLAVLGGSFPVFLVPRLDGMLNTLPSEVPVRIRWDNESWYLDNINDQRLFSFDLPQELFELYAETGELTPPRALDLSQEYLGSFHAFQTLGSEVRVIRFVLDMPWIEAIRAGLLSRVR
jgi:hypothetical protein